MEKLSAKQQAYYVGKIAALQTLGFSEDYIKEAFEKEAALPFAAIGNLISRGGAALARGGGRLAARGASKAMAPAAQGLSGRLGRMGASAMQSLGGIGQKAGKGIVQSGRAFKVNPMKAVGGGALQAGQGMLFGGGKGMGGVVGKGLFGLGTASMLMPGGQPAQMPRPYGMYGQY